MSKKLMFALNALDSSILLGCAMCIHYSYGAKRLTIVQLFHKDVIFLYRRIGIGIDDL